MAITTLSMVLTVFVLNLHHVTDTPVPNWVRRLVLVYLARFMCMFSYVSNEQMRDKSNKVPYSIVTSNHRDRATYNGQLGTHNSSINGRPSENHNNIYHGGPSTSVDSRVHSNSLMRTNADKKSSEKDEQKKKEEEYSKEWKRVAEVVDRLFFWFFFIAILITTLLLFHPLTKSISQYENQK